MNGNILAAQAEAQRQRETRALEEAERRERKAEEKKKRKARERQIQGAQILAREDPDCEGKTAEDILRELDAWKKDREELKAIQEACDHELKRIDQATQCLEFCTKCGYSSTGFY